MKKRLIVWPLIAASLLLVTSLSISLSVNERPRPAEDAPQAAQERAKPEPDEKAVKTEAVTADRAVGEDAAEITVNDAETGRMSESVEEVKATDDPKRKLLPVDNGVGFVAGQDIEPMTQDEITGEQFDEAEASANEPSAAGHSKIAEDLTQSESVSTHTDPTTYTTANRDLRVRLRSQLRRSRHSWRSWPRIRRCRRY